MSVRGKMKKLEDLRFVLTDDMNKMFIEVLIIKQRLEEDITLKEQVLKYSYTQKKKGLN